MTDALEQSIVRVANHAGVELDRRESSALAAYLGLLSRWNRAVSLTSVPLEGISDEGIERLVVQPLLMGEFVHPTAQTWFDIGSGSGSPAIPLKVLQPRLSLTLVESRGRKAAFLREVLRVLQLANARVLEARFQVDFMQQSAFADLLTVRGVRLDRGFWQAADQLLRPDGRILLFRQESTKKPENSPFVTVAARHVARGVNIEMLKRR